MDLLFDLLVYLIFCGMAFFGGVGLIALADRTYAKRRRRKIRRAIRESETAELIDWAKRAS